MHFNTLLAYWKYRQPGMHFSTKYARSSDKPEGILMLSMLEVQVNLKAF